ncbi:MAG: stage V sporulation protein AD [Eubacteriales bacterium]
MHKEIITLKNKPRILSSASVVGKKEREGPLGAYFDLTEDDIKFGQKTYEAAESECQRLALNMALHKAGLRHDELSVVISGDLINQCTSSTYGLIDLDVPYLGIFGACSTCAEGLLIGSMLIDGGYFYRAGIATSSHFCTAERQFRTPIEYGGQRTPTAQWTVTGSGAFILGQGEECLPYIDEVLPGKVFDKGIKDAANMGAAMAPAAADTLLRFFSQSDMKPSDFNLIVTGDLGVEGLSITRELTKLDGLVLGPEYDDCGCLVYDRQKQDVHAGGSGCGCSAVVTAGYIMDRFKNGGYKNVLLLGTGALMSPMTIQQGNSIAAVAHLVHIKAD